MDYAGDLFGTTVQGGADNDGAVFEIKYQNGSYASTPSILYSFTNGTDGQHPQRRPDHGCGRRPVRNGK